MGSMLWLIDDKINYNPPSPTLKSACMQIMMHMHLLPLYILNIIALSTSYNCMGWFPLGLHAWIYCASKTAWTFMYSYIIIAAKAWSYCNSSVQLNSRILFVAPFSMTVKTVITTSLKTLIGLQFAINTGMIVILCTINIIPS